MSTAIGKYKQVVVVREDLRLSRGKLAVQVAHAAIVGYERSDERVREAWILGGQKKIVLKVPNLETMMKLKENAEKAGLVTELIKDAGLTEVSPNTITALVIGPEEEDKIDKITGSLPLLR
jgi:PTH2 family peptidyl-tRNA hydrolase